MITLGEAARQTGLGKTTVARAIKAGRLSATRTATGSYDIDPAELARCYPFKAATEATEGTDATVAATGPVLWVHRTSGTPEATVAAAALEAQIVGLREISNLLQRQLDEVREDRERWRSQAEAVQRLITGPQERDRSRSQTEASERLITGPEERDRRRSQTHAGQDRRPWWRHFAGLEGLKLVALLGSILLMLGIIADKLK
jgi:excisionase family DNA binding protein